MANYISKFLYIIGARRHRLAQVIGLFLITSLLDTLGIGMVGPFIALSVAPAAIHDHPGTATIYRALNLQSPIEFVALLGLGLTMIFYLKSYLSFQVQTYVFRFSYDQKGELAKRLLNAYLAAPYPFHLNRNTSLLIQNIISETNNFCNGIMLPVLNSISYAIVTLCLAILLIKTNVMATLFILALLLVPLLLYRSFKHKLARWGKQASTAQVGMIKTINHSLGGLKETKIIGCESYFQTAMSEHVHNFESALSAAQTFKLLPRILIESLLITFLVGFTSLFLLLQQNTQNLTGILGIFAVASIRLIPAISQLTNAIGSLSKYSHTLSQLYFDLKEVETLEQDYLPQAGDTERLSRLATNRQAKLPFAVEVVLDQITYTYPQQSVAALNQISLTIRKGEAIGFIGKSGAGKTTLVDVILGLLIAESGDIRVDGRSIQTNLRSWQNLIGYIPQSIFLMDDTIEKNIAFGVPEALIDAARLEKAIHLAQLSELVKELPKGIKTVIGERGVRLSGGQRQRMGIARTLYHEREILVLDEATAALDNETERLVNDAIQSLSGIKTLIIIAHRLTTIEQCDRIYELDKGRIVNAGSYREVVLREAS